MCCLGLRESTPFINSPVKMILQPEAAAHFTLAWGRGLPVAVMSPAGEMGASS